MTDWQKRVLDERDELSVNLSKLTDFLDAEQAGTYILDSDIKALLATQKAIMEAYLGILILRISKF